MPTNTDNVVNIAKQANASDFIEVGRSGISRFGGLIYEEFLPILRGKQGIRIYTEMLKNDAVIGASIQAYEQTIRNAEWQVRPGEATQEGEKAANFLQTAMHDMSHTWDDTITDILSFLSYGWSWMEVVFKVRQGESRDLRLHSKFDDGAIGWRKIALRKQSSFFRWDFEDNGDVSAFVQQPAPDYTVRTIPISRSLLFRTRVSGNNPEGESTLRSAYRAWYIKKNIEELEAIGIERDLIGLPWIKPPEKFDIRAKANKGTRQAIEDLLYNLRRDEQDGILLPPGWEISLLGVSGGSGRRQFDLDKVINRWDKRISIALLSHAIMLGMDRVGSFALSETQTNDFFLISVQGYLNGIAEVFNRFGIPMLFAMNPEYSELAAADKLPTIVPGRVTSPSLKEIGEFVKDVTGAGYLIQNEDVHRELMRHGGFGLPILRRAKVVSSDESSESGDIFPETNVPSDNSGNRAGGDGAGNAGNGNGGQE